MIVRALLCLSIIALGLALRGLGLGLGLPAIAVKYGGSILWGTMVFLLVAITAVATLFWRRRPYLLVGWLWFLGMLVPVIGLVQTGAHSRADRYTYLSQIGLSIALAWGVWSIYRSQQSIDASRWRHSAGCGPGHSIARHR